VTESGRQPRIASNPAMGRNRGGREAFGHEDEQPKPPRRAAATFNLRRGARVSGSYPAIRGGARSRSAWFASVIQCMAALGMAFRAWRSQPGGSIAPTGLCGHQRRTWGLPFSCPRCNVASLQDETVAAVALALHVCTLPRRIRGARVTIRRLWSRRSEARTPARRPRRPPASRRGCQFFQATVQGLRVCGRRNCERANTWSDHATVALPQ
jgi:hypothetical protein